MQGRYKSYPVEDASYYWMLSRYIHLTPCLGKNPLAKSPKLWTNSSYAGYASKSGQVDFVNYDAMWEKVPADQEGKDPAGSYRRFVEQGLSQGVEDPLKSAQDNWVFGSSAFVKKVVKLTAGNSKRTSLRVLRRASAHTIDSVFQFVAKENKAKVADYIGFRPAAPGREIAVLLCRQFTPCTLGELSEYLGLNHPDSAANLSRRAKKMIAESPKYKKAFEAMRDKLQKTAD